MLWHQQLPSTLSSCSVPAASVPNEICLGLNPLESYGLDEKGDASFGFLTQGGSWFRSARTPLGDTGSPPGMRDLSKVLESAW